MPYIGVSNWDDPQVNPIRAAQLARNKALENNKT